MSIESLQRLAVLPVLIGLNSCAVPIAKPANGEHGATSEGQIQVVFSLPRLSDPQDLADIRAVIEQTITDYRSLNPRARIGFRLMDEQALERDGVESTRAGLGPDLIFTTATVFNRLRPLGIVQPPPQASMERLLEFAPGTLDALRDGEQLQALPALLSLNMLCFDRRRLATPPATLADLAAMADRGITIGLRNSLPVLIWITGALGMNLIDRQSAPFSTELIQRLSAWLSWAQRDPNVLMTSQKELLPEGLRDGRFALISCSSPGLPRLRRALGDRLAIAPFPKGSFGNGPAVGELLVWAFGRNSSGQQRRLSLDFALFSTNPEQQRRIVQRLRFVMPVNSRTQLPIKVDPVLRSLDQIAQRTFLLPLTDAVALQERRSTILSVLNKINAGETSPEVEVPRLLDLLGSKKAEQ